MKKKNILAVILLAFVIGAAIMYITLMYDKIEIQLYAAEVAEDGTIIEKGEIILSGIRNNATDKIKLDKFVLPNVKCFLPDTDGFLSQTIPDQTFEWITGAFTYEENGKMVMFDLYLSTDFSWCVIKTHSNRFFVGSTTEDFDPVDLLENVSLFLE